MRELIDLKSIWQRVTSRWAQSFGCILLAVFAFLVGGLVKEKAITDDCKFVGAFRDGPQAYNCNPRMR